MEQNGHSENTVFLTAQCFPSGAPWDTCLTMFPKHGPQQQTDDCPYILTVNVSTARYSPSDVIGITIHSMNAGESLKGIQIRVRPKEGDTERIIGQFVDWDNNKLKSLDCLGGTQNMLTHINSVEVLNLTAAWMAPNVSVGHLEFVVTFLKDFNTFWVDETFDLSASPPLPAVGPVEEMSTSFEMIDWSACGERKGCFLYPRACTGYNCYAAVTYKEQQDDNQTIEFEMFGSQLGYIAVGFSHDKNMGDDETISCTAHSSHLAIQRGYNHEELHNERQFKNGLAEIQGTYIDGRLYCRFSRPKSMFLYTGEGHVNEKTYDLTDEYYLMMAWGGVRLGTEIMSIHVELPPITDEKVNFQEHKIVRGSSLPVGKQIHGTLMLVAWILFVGLATVVARHFKQGFRGKDLGGSKVWFQVHRGCAVLGWLFTASAFILIFIIVDGWTKNYKTHGGLGIAVMTASTLQAIGGIIRPDAESDKRKFFNWGHFILGKSTQILVAVTIFFAFGNDMVPQPQRDYAYIVLSVAIAVQIFWDIWFDIERKYRRKRDTEQYELKDMNKMSYGLPIERSTEVLTPASAKRTPDLALCLYILCILAVCVAALTAIFLF